MPSLRGTAKATLATWMLLGSENQSQGRSQGQGEAGKSARPTHSKDNFQF